MHENVFVGRIEVRPPLNEIERDHLTTLAASTSTLRGTPTGRGDTEVPFALLACDHVLDGCVVGRRDDDDKVYGAEVTANRVGGRAFEPACAGDVHVPSPRGRPRPRPANVIEFRPRRA